VTSSNAPHARRPSRARTALSGRVPPVDPERQDPHQQDVSARIARSRGRVVGPFPVLLQVPALADRVQHVGAYLRYESALDRDLAEAAILATAQVWDSPLEWDEHEPLALEAGVPTAVIEALRTGTGSAAMPGPLRIVCDYARELASSGRVSSEVYEPALDLLGVARTVELTVLVGYYTMLAMTLNAHEVAATGDGAWSP
jgi:4-carboxymuconolactone decarboxylase